MTKILVVEDEPNVAAFIKKGLEEEGYEVEHVADGLEGKALATQNPYDLLILDIMLPGMGGVEICAHVRAHNPTIPILMLTALGTTTDKVKGLDSGADDYLTKPFAFAELLARIRSLTRRAANSQVQDQILQAADLEMNCSSKQVTRAGKSINLTAKEFALLEYFLRNQNKVLSRNDLARDVWDIKFDTGTNFVDVYVNYLRNKIDKPFPEKLIHTVIGMGYIMKNEPAK